MHCSCSPKLCLNRVINFRSASFYYATRVNSNAHQQGNYCENYKEKCVYIIFHLIPIKNNILLSSHSCFKMCYGATILMMH